MFFWPKVLEDGGELSTPTGAHIQLPYMVLIYCGGDPLCMTSIQLPYMYGGVDPSHMAHV